ncbi:MAG: hypothetical protein AAF541_13270 [Pseudomonadota bacterium]
MSLLFGVVYADPVYGYDGDLHQRLTFIAAKQFNECVQDLPGVDRLSALDTRYIVKANVAQSDGNVFSRMFRWSYYNRDDQTSKTFLGLLDTRFHNRFKELIGRLDGSRSRQRELQTLGRLTSFIQDVTSPAHVVPVYTGRWWRFSASDRFDRFEVDEDRVARAVAGTCSYVTAPPDQFETVLIDAATETLTAVQGPIFGFPTTWEAYWKLAENPDDFGEYGVAGNQFGQRTQFRCSGEERCLLLKDDPLYGDFATARHVAAVLGSMQAFMLFQQLQSQTKKPAQPDQPGLE